MLASTWKHTREAELLRGRAKRHAVHLQPAARRRLLVVRRGAQVSLDRQLSHRLQPGQPEALHRQHRRRRLSRLTSGRGLRYFRDVFFDPDGTPRYYHDKTYPIDIQCAAQAIETLAFCSDDDPSCLELSRKVADWTIDNMQDRQGYFYLSPISHDQGEDALHSLGPGDDVQGLGHFASAKRASKWIRRLRPLD